MRIKQKIKSLALVLTTYVKVIYVHVVKTIL